MIPYKSPISIDLLDRAERSDSFPKHWSKEKRAFALKRYERFLLLAQMHPGVALAPTRDIDEMWHLHMLSPCAYFDDCQALFGDLLDHDGGFGRDPRELPELIAVFENTERLWRAAYAEEYRVRDDDDLAATNQAHTCVEDIRNCWHDCQSRCWHACSNRSPRRRPSEVSA